MATRSVRERKRETEAATYTRIRNATVSTRTTVVKRNNSPQKTLFSATLKQVTYWAAPTRAI
jgi:peptidoglycan hydrolase-like amidase